MTYNFEIQTDIGRKRAKNQDSIFGDPHLGLFIVADGMGGHSGGEIASSMAVEVIAKNVRANSQGSEWEPKQVLRSAIEEANSEIFERACLEDSLRGMGTTATALLFKPPQLAIGQVGDSRCYMLRRGAIWQLTRDHSLVQEKLRAGLITREALRTDRMKNVITRSVGYEKQISVELFEMTPSPKDFFLICSDGLTGMIEDAEILEILSPHLFQEASAQGDHDRPPSIPDALQALIDAANDRGGDDNVSAVLVQLTEYPHG
ncbi:Stp1/IreP family PP2C-type Ser/Thr phosphatase [Bdellovibrionota bacterium FG-2]